MLHLITFKKHFKKVALKWVKDYYQVNPSYLKLSQIWSISLYHNCPDNKCFLTFTLKYLCALIRLFLLFVLYADGSPAQLNNTSSRTTHGADIHIC